MPISQSVYEPSLEFAAIAGPPRIVDRARYVNTYKPLKSRSGDPKRLWRIRLDVNVVPVPSPIRKINSKGTAILNARRAGNRSAAIPGLS
jgi:hypothetical protein